MRSAPKSWSWSEFTKTKNYLLIFNPEKTQCTYMLPLIVYVAVVLVLSSFFAQEYTVRDSTNAITIMYVNCFIYLLNCYSKVNAGFNIWQEALFIRVVSAILLVIVVLKVEVFAALITKAPPNVIPLVRLSDIGGFQSQLAHVSSASKSVDAVDK